jgi:hypothetical protein
LKSEGFCILAKKRAQPCITIEQLLLKIEESMIFGFVKERICVYSLLAAASFCSPSLLSFFLYAKKP